MAAPDIKTLGQSAPAAATTTAIYTVPSSRRAVVSTLSICETSGSATTVRVHIGIAGASAAAGNAVVYDLPISGNGSIFLTVGWTLATTDKLYVQSASGSATFTLSGEESDIPS